MSILKVFLLIASLTFSTLVLANPPTYKIEEFAKTCDAIHDEANYNTEFLRKHWRILEGQGNWLANTQMDFPDYDRIISKESVEELNRLKELLGQYNTQLMIAYLPARGLVYPTELSADTAQFDVSIARKKYISILQTLRKSEVLVPNLEALLNYKEKAPLFFEKDLHWSNEGARETARLISEQLKTLDFYDSSPSKKYETTYNGVVENDEKIKKAVAEICGFTFAPTYSKTYITTERLTQSDTSFDIFDEVTDEIVLLGTSFSALTQFNFIGYLQEYSNTSVSNYSLSGGGLIGSWVDYLKSGDFHTQPPKLIIWEVPGWRDFEPRFFHTFMPLFFDTCANEDTELSASNLLARPQIPLNNALFSATGTKATAQNLMVKVQAESPHVRSLQTRVWFKNGSSRTYTLRHASRTKSDGQFQMLLGKNHNYPNEKVIGVDIEDIQFYESAGENPEARLAIKLCKSAIPYSD
ncbi:alginate O-acetyltransferase AlgX-related protein [Alteromonas facilis]|uniref:alginate O-acetyltransferase AlgX-related protein n=1 Tax=Alteromonas facilis TaxID=2048004 RepID=UPI000C28D608|nr:hypothetical protein [Alteromonas facilis]